MIAEINKNMHRKKRIEWVDFAKGVAIILVIIGHTVQEGKNGSILRGLIFSFHMPLFFILSSLTFRFSETMNDFIKKTKLACKHLLYPVLWICVIWTLIRIIKDPVNIINLTWWKGNLFTFIFASGVETTYNGFHLETFGIPWFFLALFMGRTLFDYLHLQFKKEQLPIIVFGVSIAGICLGMNQWMPFSMDIALAIVPFFYFGCVMKKIDVESNAGLKSIGYFLVFIFTLYLTFMDYSNWTYLELAARRYTLYPICFICAIAGTMFICEISVICCKLMGILKKPIVYLGEKSLYMLCIHIFDVWVWPWWAAEGQFHSAIRRVICDVFAFVLLCIIIECNKILKNKMKKPQIIEK